MEIKTFYKDSTDNPWVERTFGDLDFNPETGAISFDWSFSYGIPSRMENLLPLQALPSDVSELVPPSGYDVLYYQWSDKGGRRLAAVGVEKESGESNAYEATNEMLNPAMQPDTPANPITEALDAVPNPVEDMGSGKAKTYLLVASLAVIGGYFLLKKKKPETISGKRKRRFL